MIAQQFDGNPFATEVKTSSFTIAAGEFAFIEVQVRNGGTFSIDGNVALFSKSKASVQAVNSTTNPFTVPSGKFLEFTLTTAGGATTTSIGGISVSTTNIQGSNWNLGPSTAIDTNSGGGGTHTINGILRDIDQEDSFYTARFEVPTGTQLTLTGATIYTVMRHKIPTAP